MSSKIQNFVIWQSLRGTAVAACLALLAGVGLQPAVAAEPAPLAEHQIKALYLFNFAKYVEWPATTNLEPFVIGVVESPEVQSDLIEITRGKHVQGREVLVRTIISPEHIKGCHILFLGGRNRQQWSELLRTAKGAAVLTVGESDGFLALGGMINFTNQDNRVRLEVGLDAVQHARLNMSAKLLAVAGAGKGRPESPRK
jgi:hypothetical protein